MNERKRHEIYLEKRTVPALRGYYHAIRKLESEQGRILFTRGQRLTGREYIERFFNVIECDKGHPPYPDSFGIGALYLLAEQTVNLEGDRKVASEFELQRVTGKTQRTIRKAKNIMLRTIGDIY
jgi:hypothetical protein